MDVAELRLAADPSASLSHLDVKGLAYDSRRVQPGFVFFCIPGQQFDGHDFALEAVNQGAVALVVERFLPLAVPQILVESARESMALAAAAFYAHPARRLLMVGVTGTNGKTTTCHLIEAVLRAYGYSVGVIGTIGNRMEKRSWPATRTTPESLDLQALLAGMTNAGADAVVMEVSSHALEQQRVQGVEFDLGVFTNLTQDHLDYHGTLTSYRAAKARLFMELGQGSKFSKKKAIINADDPQANFFAQKSAVPVITYGIDAAATVRATDLVVQAQGTRCKVAYPGGTVSLSLQLTGRFNIANALAAFTVGLAAGVDPDVGVRALGAVPGVPGRFEVIKQGQPFSVIVDYAHTPDGLENVLTTARTVTSGRVITVFGCGGDRDRTKRPKMGSVVARLSDVTVVTSDNPRTEDPENIIGDIIPGIQGVKGASYQVEVNRAEAIRSALQQARPGDLVLIAGKGHETYQVVGKTVLPFNDRKVAGAVLREMGYARG
ncbi:MAG: UDP-N-acetylmuramoyl-L-alanyl-D-glutamate--2,6-diaminopimelate ligase [Heliobacteriaceae bacterium]|nr:UDP-N-acetylmuramoyl-L-alanyl-D-glutamate--2,6-diaminopimelate ligase [Heliobacteriaceae bacterium]MDD4588082.1 UDP-N-acetylmuramoyl-L-alanyl-D-glutamate--2,6-diaminopimelate ligase [Heliobacteriaceae bacterium]